MRSGCWWGSCGYRCDRGRCGRRWPLAGADRLHRRLVAIVLFWALARGDDRPPQTRPSAHAAGERRILVVANETVGGQQLRNMIEERSRDVSAEVLVCTPALNSRLRLLGVRRGQARARRTGAPRRQPRRLHSLGIDASGEVGDADPLQAIEDALRTFGADEIIISTHPEGRSNWLERGVVDHAASGSPSRSGMSSSTSTGSVRRFSASGGDGLRTARRAATERRSRSGPRRDPEGGRPSGTRRSRAPSRQ